jgi:hypothetical protein
VPSSRKPSSSSRARAAGLGRRDLVEVVLEVAADAAHVGPGVLGGDGGRGVADHGAVDVERDVAPERAGARHGVEQDAGLGGGAGPELDELADAGGRDDRVGARLEDRALGAGRVVLGQLADPVEQRGAARVVEVLGRQLLGGAGEAVEDVVGERAPGGAERHASHASLTPEKIWRRWGRSQLRKVVLATRALVAQEPPRRT